MHASAIRRQLSTLIPPKIATPRSVAGGSGEGLTPLVDFYSKLPKGPAPASAMQGFRARYFEGPNASAAPILYTVLGLVLFGYTLDYNMHLKHHKNHAH